MQRLTSISQVKQLTRKYDFKVKKKFGQNFLICDHVLDQILDEASLTSEDLVVEIGPGLGVLTQELAKRAGQVIAVEIDRTVVPILQERLPDFSNLQIINEDILEINLDEVVKETGHTTPYKVVANLPYYITTPIIMQLLEKRYKIKQIVIMVQKEVAERIVADAGSKIYGALSVAVQYYAKPKLVAKVPADCFWPAPEVESAVVSLEILEQPPIDVEDEETFFQVVKGAFATRRKTLLNSLSNYFGNMEKERINLILNDCGIDPKRRGETLSLVEYSILANAIYKEIKS